MITVKKTISTFETFHNYYNYDPEQCIFFDIETTGLSAASAFVFLIGTVSLAGHEWILTQWFAETPEEEPDIIQEFLHYASSCHTLIHFNGTTFDIPFIKERYPDAVQVFEHMDSIDLYQKFRPLKKLYQLNRMNQQSLEQFIHWPRKDQLTGKHMIELYKKYIPSKEPSVADLLLLHNHDDLLGMTALLSLTGSLQLFQKSGFEFKETTINVRTKSNSVAFCFSLDTPVPISFSIDRTLSPEVSCSFSVTDTSCELRVSLYEGELKYFFPDHKNYYYLPTEDQAIHKSIGEFVDRAFRQNATPATCYIRKQGLFLPQLSICFTPSFKAAYNDKLSYFEYTDYVQNDREMLKPYIITMIQHLFSSL